MLSHFLFKTNEIEKSITFWVRIEDKTGCPLLMNLSEQMN